MNGLTRHGLTAAALPMWAGFRPVQPPMTVLSGCCRTITWICQSWSVQRHWPSAPITASASPEQTVAEMIADIRSQLAILIEGERRVALTLTAGRDTRILLACARPFLDKLTFATVVGEDSHTTDTVMARAIAAEYGLNYVELPRAKTDQSGHDIYMRRGGHCVGDANSWYFPSIAPIAKDHVLVGGAGGEIGRAFFWRASDTDATELNASAMIGRMGMQKDPDLTQRMDRWLSNTNQSDARMVLDLAYIEQRMGPWGAAQFCNDPTMPRIAPLVSRNTVEQLIRLPDVWKRNETLAEEVMRQAWPRIGEVPVQQPRHVSGHCRQNSEGFGQPRPRHSQIAARFQPMRRQIGRSLPMTKLVPQSGPRIR